MRTQRLTIGLVASLLVSACNDAFRSSSSTTGSTNNQFEATFPGGSAEGTVREDGVILLTVQIPEIGYGQLLRDGGVDTSLLQVRATPDPVGDGGTNLAPLLDSESRIARRPAQDGRVAVDIDLPARGLFDLPLGLVLVEIAAIDDIGRESPAITLELTVVAADRPTASIRLEIPPTGTEPSGLLLPVDGSGTPFIGENLPFVIVIEALPNPDSEVGLDGILTEDGVDPERLIVVADADLGTGPGFFAGENLAPLFGTDLDSNVDPDTGKLTVAALFTRDGPFGPLLGNVSFTAKVIDDDATESPETSSSLLIEAAVTLDSVQEVFQAHCAFGGCHGDLFPALDLVLSTAENSFNNLVGVEASEPQSGTCSPLRVEPYAPETSYLLFKMLGTHDDEGSCAEGTGDPMPPSGPLQDTSLIERVADWTAQGAHD